jgi:uridine kinase
MKALVIGIAGGSGSGKTTVANRIIDSVGEDNISFLGMDSYYKDLSSLPEDIRIQRNFDHPSSIDVDLFIQHVSELKDGRDIEAPIYDFVTHTRRPEKRLVKAHPVIILEGILLYENATLLNLIDIKTFVEAPSDIRFIRRLMRDIKERGRTTESVVNQYLSTVRPMYKTFVAPTKEFADIIIPWKDYNDVAIEMVISRIRAALRSE